MSSKVRLPKERVNFFDGQQITESDLDTEQIYHQTVTSELALDFHGSGVLNLEPFSENILLDTRRPGQYSADGDDNPSKLDIENGGYDGLGISLDRQPSDNVRGNRLVFELVNVNIIGRNRPKIMIIGRTFNGTDSAGILNFEFIEFEENAAKLTKNYYQNVNAIFFNNFSGGTGRTETKESVDSLDLISASGGYLIVKEAEPLKVFVQPIMQEQVNSPNFDMANFITSSPSRDIETEIALALDATSTVTDLFIDLTSKSQISFPKDGDTTTAYGQKFLSKSNNLQRIDLLLSVERDDDQPAGEEFSWSGDLVLGIHEISGTTRCPTDAVPDDLIEFDPDLNPILEVSFGQDDLEALGYKLTDEPQVVSFNFAGTLIADPNIDPSIEKGKYYAFILSRRGDNRTGTILLEKGYDNVRRKQDLGLELSIVEQFAKQESRYLEFDSVREKYLDDPNSSLWFRIFSNDIEIVSGTAYSDTGKSISIPKTQKYVGGNEISYFENHIPLASIAGAEKNYVILNYVEKFTDADTHPLTGNFIFTRIQDAAAGTVVDSAGLADLLEDTYPLVLARVIDNNVRDASDITGELSKPGQIDVDRIIIINPSSTLLNSNLIGRIITPDTDCICNSRYRIASTVCREILAGDLNGDGELDYQDIDLLLDVVGNTINSSVTEKAILGGELDLLDFIRSDLNDDGTVDGFDIDLLENAIDGYVNFTVDEKIKILELILENVLEEDDYPTLFTDAASTGSTSSGSDTVTITTTSINEALAIRIGDTIQIPTGVLDSGSYLISGKTVETDGVTVVLTVTDLSGNKVSFQGSSGFNAVIVSGTRVNTFADNLTLLDVPYTSKNFTISYVDFPFSQRFVDVCDLRRFVSTAFIEEEVADPCACDEVECADQEVCAPVYKTQQYFAGDIYLPHGQILTEPGIPHPGDYEYVNVIVPLPPGTISDCAINLYKTFVAVDSNCKTAAGFPAMQYSDGSYVGCNDSGAVTDLSQGRVKFSHAIASLYVDAFVDGYAVDGYADATFTTNNEEAIAEQFTDYTYTAFDSWSEDGFNDITFGSVTRLAGTIEPAVFDVTTIGSSGTKYVQINTPIESTNFSGDFIVDITATRSAWPQSSLLTGSVFAQANFEISNDDGSSATLSLGWRGTGGSTAKIFYSGIIRNPSNTVVDSFEHLVDAPDTVGEALLFRLRRINDSIFAYYIVPGKIGDTESNFGHYIRIGTNPSVQPGDGTVVMDFEVKQTNAPTSGANFIINLNEVVIRSDYSSDNSVTTVPLGRVGATNVIDRLTCNFPINLTSRTNIIGANLNMTVTSGGTVSDYYNIIPLEILDADNLGRIHNVPQTQNNSIITSFIPGTIAIGDVISVDVSTAILSFLAAPGHLPGFVKGFIIEPAGDADSSFEISPIIELVITYKDVTTGVVFQVGVSVDPNTGIATFNTKNILYDSTIEENRTVINFGVHLKKSGFRNNDLHITIGDLDRIGIGTCKDDETITGDDECYFIVGNTATGTFVEGPFPCQFHLP